MNEETEYCPSCEINLHSHNNQQIIECVNKQFEQFSKQKKEFLISHSGKSLIKETTHRIGGIIIV